MAGARVGGLWEQVAAGSVVLVVGVGVGVGVSVGAARGADGVLGRFAAAWGAEDITRRLGGRSGWVSALAG
jgi:hypothetical protein